MRQLRILPAVLAATLLITGCGSKKTDVDIVPADAAASILEQVTFRDSLLEATEGIAAQYYMLDDTITDYAIFISGSGATAEEVGVLKVANDKDAAHAKELLEARVQTLKDMFENYRPDEMVKLSDPVVESRGNVVYFVCCDDPGQARDAIASLYK